MVSWKMQICYDQSWKNPHFFFLRFEAFLGWNWWSCCDPRSSKLQGVGFFFRGAQLAHWFHGCWPCQRVANSQGIQRKVGAFDLDQLTLIREQCLNAWNISQKFWWLCHGFYSCWSPKTGQLSKSNGIWNLQVIQRHVSSQDVEEVIESIALADFYWTLLMAHGD